MEIRKLFLTGILLCGLLDSICYAIPRPEHPRPQFVRNDWENLNGDWTYNFDFNQSGKEKGLQKSKGFSNKIVVPFAPESRLSGVEYKDFINQMWYHRKIKIAEKWSSKNILLHFGAVYYDAEIYIDGTIVGRHFGGTSSFSFDITDFVKDANEHDLVVLVKSDVRSGKQSAGKQSLQYGSYGCNYTRTTGIWQTVWLEAVHKQALKRAVVRTNIDDKQITIFPVFYTESSYQFTVILKDNGKEIATKIGNAHNASTITLPVKNLKTWSPESPFLYDLIYQVKDPKGNIIDEVVSYVGMRKIHIDGNKIFLNNQPLYQRLVLDQGFYPDGIWTAPNDEALRNDIELSMSVGFNGARLHQKVFEERFHYWADKLGYITWGEASSWGMDCNDMEVSRNFLTEWSEIVTRDINHPSILIWTPLNEQWWPDKVNFPRFVEDLYFITKSIDPTRPFHDVSGGTHIKTDIWSVHHYEQKPEELKKIIYNEGHFFETPNLTVNMPTMNIGFNPPADNNEYMFRKYDKKIPLLVDEFGGIKWNPIMQESNIQNESWGYGDAPKNIEEFYSRLEGQVDALLSLSEFVWGYCYTQLTDVEQEQNGLFYYDRTPKFDKNRLYNIFNKKP